MATIFTRGNKLWIQYSLNGKQYRDPLNMIDNRENRSVARKLAKQKEVDIDNGIYNEKKKRIKNKGIPLSEGFQDFKATKQNKASKTILAYETAFNSFKEFVGDIVIGKITDSAIQKYEKYLSQKIVIHPRKNKNKEKKLKEIKKISPNTIANYFNHLKIIFKYFEMRGYIKDNPFPAKKMEEKQIKIIPDEILDDILIGLRKKSKTYYKTIILFLMTGLRANELTSLNFEDIDFKNNIIKVKNSKGRRDDFLPLYPELKEFIFNNWDNMEGKLVPFKNRDSLKFWDRFLDANDFPHYSIHTLRKTFLSHLVNSGLNVYDVKTMARHNDIKTTMKFYLAADLSKLGDKVNTAIKLQGNLVDNKSKNLKLVPREVK